VNSIFFISFVYDNINIQVYQCTSIILQLNL